MWTKKLLPVLLAHVFLYSAAACDCGPPSSACAYVGRANVVFVGTVKFTDHDPTMGLRQRTFVRFAVEQAFKGLDAGTRDIWIDPGSFTSCYAEYNVGERLLVFGYGGVSMPPDAAVMSLVPGRLKPKPLPEGMDRKAAVYSAPGCSGTRPINSNDPGLNADLVYLHQLKAGSASTSVRGRVTEDWTFGIFGFDPIPGLRGVKVTLTSDGLKRSTVTDENGYYSIVGTPPGLYSVEPYLRGYTSGRQVRDVEVPRVGCGAADFDMIGSGSVEGTLVNSAGLPAANIRVELLRLNREGKPIYYAEKETTTNAKGEFSFSQLPRGDFHVGVK
jgi:hypothetical protein